MSNNPRPKKRYNKESLADDIKTLGRETFRHNISKQNGKTYIEQRAPSFVINEAKRQHERLKNLVSVIECLHKEFDSRNVCIGCNTSREDIEKDYTYDDKAMIWIYKEISNEA